MSALQLFKRRIARAVGIFDESFEDMTTEEIVSRVEDLRHRFERLGQQAELVSLANQAAREIAREGRITGLPVGAELLVNGELAKLGQTIRKDDKLSLRSAVVTLPADPIDRDLSSMDLWRTLLALADAATPEGRISEEEWIGICRSIYAMLRYEEGTPCSKCGAPIPSGHGWSNKDGTLLCERCLAGKG